MALTQQNGSTIHQMVKDKARTYHWRIVLSKLLQDTTKPESYKSRIIQPMLVSLQSVLKDTSRFWAKQDYSTDNEKSLPVENIMAPLDSNNAEDVILHFERTRRIMIAKALLGMFKSGALNTIMLKRTCFSTKETLTKPMMMVLPP